MRNNTTPEWFDQFHDFTYDATVGLKSNFQRLAAARQWGTARKSAQWVSCQTVTFDSVYGTDTTKLEVWQELCREVYIKNPPKSIKGCKKVLGSRNVLVNLVNLIDHRLSGAKVIRFPNHDAFWAYTSKGRKFPLSEAKKDGFIKVLLRQL
ncbi:hypothetical protein IQ06DRAFT_347927 [Phaeosphaeriaceae sp. SRC1lsM3a]|nr:hypothetical protein IQ06DRAFT_347927 [Stagonospora sp. SRC1lsM3a]